MNQYMRDPDFNINTRQRLAYFLSQITAETDGFSIMAEKFNYKKSYLLNEYPSKFNLSNVNSYLNCMCVFDKIYCCRNGNGDEASKDGSKYRGQGVIQLTWEEEYKGFTNYYQNKFNDFSVDFVQNPQLLQTNMKYSVLSALWEACKLKGLDKAADKNDIFTYSKRINGIDPTTGEPNGYDKRKNNLAKAKAALCLQ